MSLTKDFLRNRQKLGFENSGFLKDECGPDKFKNKYCYLPGCAFDVGDGFNWFCNDYYRTKVPGQVVNFKRIWLYIGNRNRFYDFFQIGIYFGGFSFSGGSSKNVNRCRNFLCTGFGQN